MSLLRCAGKVGAIISALWISYISDRQKVFLVSALFGLGGAIVTWCGWGITWASHGRRTGAPRIRAQLVQTHARVVVVECRFSFSF
jgi:hypothetical protein